MASKVKRMRLCACGECFKTSEEYFKHRKVCGEYPWDETDAEMEAKK